MINHIIYQYTMAKIYVACGWRYVFYHDVILRLRDAGYEVYDFRNSPYGNGVFHYRDDFFHLIWPQNFSLRKRKNFDNLQIISGELCHATD